MWLVLFLGLLHTHLKIILLQCFQFSVFSFNKNKLYPNGHLLRLHKIKIQKKERPLAKILATAIFFLTTFFETKID